MRDFNRVGIRILFFGILIALVAVAGTGAAPDGVYPCEWGDTGNFTAGCYGPGMMGGYGDGLMTARGVQMMEAARLRTPVTIRVAIRSGAMSSSFKRASARSITGSISLSASRINCSWYERGKMSTISGGEMAAMPRMA